MPILLKDIKKLNEIHYHAPGPDLNAKFYNQFSDSNENRKRGLEGGKQMFYDFYAMELLWSWLGSGSMPRKEREKLRNLPDDHESRNVIKSPISGHFLSQAQINVIDDVYDQVAKVLSRRLISYIYMAVVQEFRYIVAHSYAWRNFKYDISMAITKANTMGTKISREEFNKIMMNNIPEMKKYPDTIKKLLKFSKYFDTHSADAYTHSRHAVGTSKSEPELQHDPDLQGYDEKDGPKMATEIPDDTDYNAEVEPDMIGKVGEPTGIKLPGEDGYEDEKELDEPSGKEPLNEETINLGKIKMANSAINKAGITLIDIERAFNCIPWGDAYGGPKWGEGAISLLKLMDARKFKDAEDLNAIIDHIYDLQHNTGALLNKGPMYVSNEDLNRRAKITHIARYLPYVSPTIGKLIKFYLRYFPGDAEQEAKKLDIVNSPALKLPPDQEKRLFEKGFQVTEPSNLYLAKHLYLAKLMFKDKTGYEVPNTFYLFKYHKDGEYSISDNLKADVHVFKTFDDALKYVDTFEREIKKPISDPSGGLTKGDHNLLKSLNEPKSVQILPLNSSETKAIEQSVYKSNTSSLSVQFTYNLDKAFCISFNHNTTNPVFKLYKKLNSDGNYMFALKQTFTATTPSMAFFDNIDDVKNQIGNLTKSYIEGSAPKKPISYNLPPNLESPLDYSNPPSKNLSDLSGFIRLTIADEYKLKEYGFEPKIVEGVYLCYIHNGTGDTIVFQSNNSAKLMFKKTGASIKLSPISNAIDYLIKNYKNGIDVSPMNKVVAHNNTSVNKPVKVGPAFEGKILNAGFKWNPQSNRYVDGLNDLEVYSNRTSRLIFNDAAGQSIGSKTFNNLVELFGYLQNEYKK